MVKCSKCGRPLIRPSDMIQIKKGNYTEIICRKCHVNKSSFNIQNDSQELFVKQYNIPYVKIENPIINNSKISPDLSKVLFLITCSYRKNIDQIPSERYNIKKSIQSKIEKPEILIKGRKRAYEILLSIDFQGPPLRENPNNLNLKFGPDFGGTENGNYLGAINRYNGRFYNESGLGAKGKVDLLNSYHDTLIISGLYGLVSLQEPIQLYECGLEYLRPFYNNWVEDDLLTNVLLDYIETNHVTTVVDLTSQYEYRNLIYWKKLHEKKDINVLHGHCKTIAGSQALPDISHYLKEILLKKTPNEFKVPSLHEENNCRLTDSVVPPKNWPYEQSLRIEKALSEGESHTIEFKANITDGTFDMYDRIAPAHMKYTCMKSISSFMNSDGGDLLVGVDDETHEVFGIEKDLLPYNYSIDDFLHIIDRIVLFYIGRTFVPNIRPKIWSYKNKPILLIEVIKSKYPACLRLNINGKPRKEFWVRGNKGDIQYKKVAELKKYVKDHFGIENFTC